MASRSTNTMAEALQKMIRDIADMKTLPDADMPFLVQLENIVLNRMKQPVQDLRDQGQLPAQQPPPFPGAGGGMPGGMGAPAGSLMGGGAMAGPQAPNAGELARLLNAGAEGM